MSNTVEDDDLQNITLKQKNGRWTENQSKWLKYKTKL